MVAFRLSLDEFKKRLYQKHGNKFTVVESSYTKYRNNVDIICPHNIVFSIRASRIAETEGNHGHGCKQCKVEYAKYYTQRNKEKTFDKILADIKEVHSNENYTYDKAKESFFATDAYNLTITCPHHGDFTRTVFQQKLKGCPKCSKILKNRDLLRFRTPRELIRDLRLLHGDYYDFSHIEWVGKINTSSVPIICPKHGLKNVKIITLLRGGGCEACVKNQSIVTGKTLLQRMKKDEASAKTVLDLFKACK